MPPRTVSSLGPSQPHHIENLKALRPVRTEHVKIRVEDAVAGEAPGILHYPEVEGVTSEGAVILISGAGGGVSGPSGMYPSLATKLAAALALPTLRLDYRRPAQNTYCVADVVSSMSHLSTRFSASRFVLVGWSFGGAPAFTVAASTKARIAGVATVASQTAQTSGISKLAPEVPVLLLHGTGDTTLSPRCSENLYDWYGPHGDRTMKLFEGDGHTLSKNAPEAERLIFEFAARCLGRTVGGREEKVAAADLSGGVEERIQTMREGHDLDGGERL